MERQKGLELGIKIPLVVGVSRTGANELGNLRLRQMPGRDAESAELSSERRK